MRWSRLNDDLNLSKFGSGMIEGGVVGEADPRLNSFFGIKKGRYLKI